MFEILILEDDSTTRNQLVSKVKSISTTVCTFATDHAEEANTYLNNNKISAFFLDIQVKGFTGLELARKIRRIKRYQFTPIIFITAMPTRELEAFRQLHCYDYIIKPYTDEEIERVFEEIILGYIGESPDKENEKLVLKFQHMTQLVDMQDIVYVEYKDRKIVIKTHRDEITYIHMPLKRFKELLKGNFIQIHQSIVINMEYIEKVDIAKQQVKQLNIEEYLPIGRSYLKKVGEKTNELL